MKTPAQVATVQSCRNDGWFIQQVQVMNVELTCADVLDKRTDILWLLTAGARLHTLQCVLGTLKVKSSRIDMTTRGHGRRHYSASKSASPVSILR